MVYSTDYCYFFLWGYKGRYVLNLPSMVLTVKETRSFYFYIADLKSLASVAGIHYGSMFFFLTVVN